MDGEEYLESYYKIVDMVEVIETVSPIKLSDEMAKIMTDARAAVAGDPGELRRMADGWDKAADTITEHVNVMQAAVSREMTNWEGDAADNFANYMARLADVLEYHKEKTAEVKAQLENVSSAIDEARADIADMGRSASNDIEDLLDVAGAGALGGAFGVLGALTGGVVSLLHGKVDHVNQLRADKERAIGKAFADLRELIDQQTIQKITGPPKPVIATAPSFSSEQFYSRHQPPEIGDVKISTDPQNPQFPWWLWTNEEPPVVKSPDAEH